MDFPYARIVEPIPTPDIADAVSAAVHDPLWFLARQWQLGEFQGENASTPVRVEGLFTTRAIHPVNAPHATEGMPPEAVIESENGDAWVADELIYEKQDAFQADGVAMDVRQHRGGRVDWYSVDATPGSEEPEPQPLAPLVPAKLDFPGMPKVGTWQIEDTTTDYAALAPDARHTSTAILLNLVQGHRDEWFSVPIGVTTGVVVEITEFRVTDSFGETWLSTDLEDALSDGLRPPTELIDTPTGALPWGLFHSGAPGLILWTTVDRPLESEPVERVQFGVDDQSNLVWAVERRLDGQDPPPMPPADEDNSLIPEPPGDQDAEHEYHYVPGIGAEAYWIPYALDEGRTDGPGKRLLRRSRLVDLSQSPPRELPDAQAVVLATTLTEGVIPLAGLEVERRWQLARDAAGRPHLWMQKQRGPLRSVPARTLRFDVAMATDPTPTAQPRLA